MKEFRVHSCFDYIYMCVCNECNIYIYAAKWRQLCSTLCDPIDGSPPGSSVPGILQARTLEWVAISFSNARKWKAKVKSLSRVRLLATPWTAAHQAPPSTEVSRQEYWSGSPVPSPIYIYRLKIVHFCHQLLSTCVCTIHGYLCDMKINKTWKL